MSEDGKAEVGGLIDKVFGPEQTGTPPAAADDGTEDVSAPSDDALIAGRGAEPGYSSASGEAVTTGQPAKPPAQPRKTKGGKKDDDMAQTQQAPSVYPWLGEPSVSMKLFRTNNLSGQRVEIGSWASKHPRFFTNRAQWVREYAGGGEFTLAVYKAGTDFGHFLGELSFELPGEQKTPGQFRTEEDADDGEDVISRALSLGKKGKGMGMDIGTLLLLETLGGRREKAPAAPPPDPRIDALLSANAEQKAELARLREETARERQQTAADTKFAALEAKIDRMLTAAATPKESAVDKLIANLPTVMTLVGQFTAGRDRMLTELRAESNARNADMWKALEKITAAGEKKGGDLEGSAKGFAQMATLTSTMLAGTARLLQAGAPQQGPLASMATDLLGKLGNMAASLGPLWIMSKVSEKDPKLAAQMQAELEAYDGGEEGSGDPYPPDAAEPRRVHARVLPDAAPAKTLPTRPAPGTAVAPSAAPAPARGPSEDPRRIPARPVQLLAEMVAARQPAEKVIEALAGYVAFCDDFDLVPLGWRQDGSWEKVSADPVAGLAWLFARLGRKVEIPADYAAALRSYAGSPEPVEGGNGQEEDGVVAVAEPEPGKGEVYVFQKQEPSPVVSTE